MLSILLPAFADMLTGLSNAVFQLANGICGRSIVLDTLLTLALDNPLVKAGVVGGCLLAAWHAAKNEDALHRSRRILLIALMAALAAAATTKTLSRAVFLPRPFIESQKAFHLDGDRLVESPRVAYRPPLDQAGQAQYQSLLAGNVLRNDFGSFPSDHAGFYATVALGIWLASRTPGAIALTWTFVVILGSRIITGQHSPLDVAAGAGIGIVILLAWRWIADRWFARVFDGIVQWTLRHPAFSGAVMFMAAFEVVDTLQSLRDLVKTLAAVGRVVIGV
jgi:membrane-associated phospholipid phosphatase